MNSRNSCLKEGIVQKVSLQVERHKKKEESVKSEKSGS